MLIAINKPVTMYAPITNSLLVMDKSSTSTGVDTGTKIDSHLISLNGTIGSI